MKVRDYFDTVTIYIWSQELILMVRSVDHVIVKTPTFVIWPILLHLLFEGICITLITSHSNKGFVWTQIKSWNWSMEIKSKRRQAWFCHGIAWLWRYCFCVLDTIIRAQIPCGKLYVSDFSVWRLVMAPRSNKSTWNWNIFCCTRFHPKIKFFELGENFWLKADSERLKPGGVIIRKHNYGILSNLRGVDRFGVRPALS